MKEVLEKIKELVKKYPNDMELGSKIRHFILEYEKKNNWKDNFDSVGSL